jgi:hypothetical protein
MKLEFSGQIFKKYSNIKFHENPSIGSRVAPRGHSDRRMDRRTDMMKLVVAFHNFVKAPKTYWGDSTYMHNLGNVSLNKIQLSCSI